MPGKRRVRNAFGGFILFALGLTVGASLVAEPWSEAARGEGAARLLPVTASLLASGTTVAGEAISYPSGAPARITAAVVTLAPGAETGWHTHVVPVFGYMLEGELTVLYAPPIDRGASGASGGQPLPAHVRVLRPGDALLEAMAVPHNGRNTGDSPVRILAVYMGAEGTELTKKSTP